MRSPPFRLSPWGWGGAGSPGLGHLILQPGWVLDWRWLAVLGCVPPSFMLLLMCCMPETPRFLLTQHQRQEAVAAAQFLWGSEQDWEEPPVGAEHQVRGWEVELWEGISVASPLCIQGGRAASSQGCTHTRRQGVPCCPACQQAKACLSSTAWWGSGLGDHWESLALDLTKEKAQAGSQGRAGRLEDLDLYLGGYIAGEIESVPCTCGVTVPLLSLSFFMRNRSPSTCLLVAMEERVRWAGGILDPLALCPCALVVVPPANQEGVLGREDLVTLTNGEAEWCRDLSLDPRPRWGQGKKLRLTASARP